LTIFEVVEANIIIEATIIIETMIQRPAIKKASNNS